MIYPVTMYAAKCDNCGNGWEYDAMVALVDHGQMKEMLDNEVWHTEGDKHYCPDCFSWGDDDELLLTPQTDV